MYSVKQYFSKSNSYINLEPFYHFDDTYFFNKTFEFSNFPTSLSDFYSDLQKFELENNQSGKRSNFNIRYGVVLTFMIPCELSNTQIINLSNNLINSYNLNNNPVYVYSFKEGKGYYLSIYVSEREYYPEGKEISIKSNYDQYKSTKTGRLCKKEDENAKLFRKKGTTIRKEVVNFSNKTKLFQFATNKQFDFFINNLKEIWIEWLNEICNVEIEENMTFTKVHTRGLVRQKRKTAELWNKAFNEMEVAFNNALIALKYSDCYDTSEREIMYKFYLKYQEIFKQDKSKYGKFNIRINNAVGDFKIIISEVELMVRKFTEDLNKLMSGLIPCCF